METAALEEKLHGAVDGDVDVGGVVGERTAGAEGLEFLRAQEREVLPREEVVGDAGLEGLGQGGRALDA
jgi:hypothetical protein